MVNDSRNMDNVRKLTAALRSGDYRQTFHKLKRDEGFCCLGVACDISGFGKWEHDLAPESYLNYTIRDNEGKVTDENYNLLPSDVAKWLGIQESGAFRYYYPESLRETNGLYSSWTLTELNDSGQFSFAQIADVLESEYVVFLKPGADQYSVDEDC